MLVKKVEPSPGLPKVPVIKPLEYGSIPRRG